MLPKGICCYQIERDPDLRKRVFKTRTKRVPELVPKIIADGIHACRTGAGRWPLTLLGKTGVGKTCAALVFLDWLRFGHSSMYATLREWVDWRRSAVMGEWYGFRGDSSRQSDRDFLQLVGNMTMIVIDELSRRSMPSDFERETVHEMLDAREGTGLILISNRRPAQVQNTYSDAVWRRIKDGTVVELFDDVARIQPEPHPDSARQTRQQGIDESLSQGQQDRDDPLQRAEPPPLQQGHPILGKGEDEAAPVERGAGRTESGSGVQTPEEPLPWEWQPTEGSAG